MNIFDKRNKKLHTSSSLVLLITYYFEERTYYLIFTLQHFQLHTADKSEYH